MYVDFYIDYYSKAQERFAERFTKGRFGVCFVLFCFLTEKRAQERGVHCFL